MTEVSQSINKSLRGAAVISCSVQDVQYFLCIITLWPLCNEKLPSSIGLTYLEFTSVVTLIKQLSQASVRRWKVSEECWDTRSAVNSLKGWMPWLYNFSKVQVSMTACFMNKMAQKGTCWMSDSVGFIYEQGFLPWLHPTVQKKHIYTNLPQRVC